jgi:hypothetical protein
VTADPRVVAVAIGALADRLGLATTRHPEVFLAALADFCRAAHELGIPAVTVHRVVEYHLASDARVSTSTIMRARELADAHARNAG